MKVRSFIRKKGKIGAEQTRIMSAIALLLKSVVQERLNSCCGHDNGIPLAMSIPLAEESIGLSAVYTRSSPLDSSTPSFGDWRPSNSLYKWSRACSGPAWPLLQPLDSDHPGSSGFPT